MDLVQNGSFESTTLTSSGFFAQFGNGVSQPSNEAGWTVDCAAANGFMCDGSAPDLTVVFPGTGTSDYGYNGAALYGPMPATSPDGGNFVAEDGDSQFNAPFSQTITGLTPGQYYLLSFYQAAAQQVGLSGPTTEMWQVSLGSETFDSTVMDNPSQGFTPWNAQDLTFQATSATEVLTFLSLGTPSGAPPIALLDGVSLTGEATAPEPSCLALLGVGVLGLFAVRRRRQKRN